MREIAVRMFINEKFAGSYGNMVFNRAAYAYSSDRDRAFQIDRDR